MTLTAADVAEIMRLVEQSTFDELDLEIDGVKLSLRRTGAGGPVTRVTPGAEGTAHTPAPKSMTPSPTATPKPTDARAATPGPGATTRPPDETLKDITSPMLGTFYRAPKPGAEPFVQVGSSVQEDSVIAIIEVMKLMNTVRAGVRGVVTEILPADETLVEFGQVLMRARVDA